MRVPPPASLKLDQKALLRDIKERLADKLPQYAAGEDDPNDPGWLLLEQAAWTAELLSEQLDRYPVRVVQHFVHMMGGQLRPAQPAVGMVVAAPASEGELRVPRELPSPWRFYTRQTEQADAVEFSPVERGVSLRRARLLSAALLEGGRLHRVEGKARDEDLDDLESWPGEPRRSAVFDREELRYVLLTNTPDTHRELLENAIARMAERRVGWLRLELEQEGPDRLVLVARVDPAGAFEQTAPGGVWSGGDLEGDWGTLVDSTWTPPVTVSHHPLLPARLRGSRPMPGSKEGRILVPDVPENFSTADLLVRQPSPVPRSVVEAIWKSLVFIDVRLAPFHPTVERRYPLPEEAEGEPNWVGAALSSGVWERLVDGPPRTAFHVALESRRRAPLRLALVLDGAEPDHLPRLQVYPQEENGVIPDALLHASLAWTLPLPSPDGGPMVLVAAYDVELSEDVAAVLAVVDGRPRAFFLDALLVANVPAVRDGREIRVQRNVPEGVSLLYPDAVTREVMEQLLEEPIPKSAARQLAGLTLAYFTQPDGPPILDWEGMGVDASEGLLTLNHPDRDGYQRDFRPGSRIKLNWYRRTDGGAGDVPPGAIQLLEQDAGVQPSLWRVRNPLGTFYGGDRETPEAAVDRLFAPAGGTPVLPADFERLVRTALGSRGRDWVVRVWSYAERALVSCALWPLEPGGPGWEEATRLERELADAGPETLLVVLGPREGGLSAEDLDWARRAVKRLVRRLSRRLPVLRDAVVARFWPLVLRCEERPTELELPAFDVLRMRGELVDELGRRAAPPQAATLLNAGVLSVEETGRAE